MEVRNLIPAYSFDLHYICKGHPHISSGETCQRDIDKMEINTHID